MSLSAPYRNSSAEKVRIFQQERVWAQSLVKKVGVLSKEHMLIHCPSGYISVQRKI